MNDRERMFDRAFEMLGEGADKSEIYGRLYAEGYEHIKTYADKKSFERQLNKRIKAQSSTKDNVKPLKDPEVITLNQDGSQTHETWVKVYEKEQLKDPMFLLELHGYDPKTWEVVWAKSTMWQQGVMEGIPGRKHHHIYDLYASKITVRAKTEIDFEDIREIHKELVHNYKLPSINFNFKKHTKLAEFNIADPHIGKLAWHGDSGENYDYKIATERYMSQVEDFISKTSHVKIEKIIFPFSHDLLHVDTPEKTTTAGTPQDVDIRPRKIYKVTKELLIKAIDTLYLAKQCPIELIWVEDNHGQQSSFHLALDMDSWYRREDYITVDSSTLDESSMGRKYYKYGNCALLMLHGTKMTDKKIAELMAKEQPRLFGETIYREAHPGHIHKDGGGIFEDNGVTVRRLPSITATDKWHFDNGYVGSLKRSKHFIWDKETGVEEIIMTPVIT